jgi:adenylate kinase
MQKPHTFIFIGRSGAGKGTQIQLLIEKLKAKTTHPVFHLEPGNSFRAFVAGDSYSSSKAKELAAKGELQPSFLTVWVWADLLVKNATGNEHMLFDGMPRRMSEAKILESALKFYEVEKPKVINIHVSDTWAVEKLLARGRADDTEESIKRRMHWYEKDVEDTIEYMKHNSFYEFLSINGEQTIEEVHAEICEKIGL